jgi:26S proteasome regulatory subunit N9
MKALSLGLIKGKIDQVEQVVEIEWVQPRVLDKQQIQAMSQRIKEWGKKVADLGQELTKETPELFVH